MSAKASPALRVLTASNQHLSKVSHISCPSPRNEVAVLNADGNNLSTLSGIECYPALIQLSARDNSIVRMEAVRFTANLVTLNLQGNSISEMAGLGGLVNLQWVSLAGNTIVSMNNLGTCVKLNYLDLSENCITELSDIMGLSSLKTLLLHGNAINSLQSVSQCLPQSLLTLSLAENEVSDLNEASFLRSLSHLEQLSLLNNPCVSITDARIFDFRPYILFWCSSLTVLDGVEVTAEERQSSQTLFPPGKPYPFSLGEHHVLVHYLSSIYPIPMPNASHGSLPGKNTTAMSLSELEGLLAQSSSKDHKGLISKLRALQLVEQMIATQEQLIGTEGNDAKPPTEIKAESAVNKIGLVGGDASPKVLSTSEETQDMMKDRKRVDAEFVAGSDSGVGALSYGGKDNSEFNHATRRWEEGGESGIPSCASSERKKEDFRGASGTSSESPSLTVLPSKTESVQERGHKQLRLLNEKLAKRHSNLPRREATTRHSKLPPGETTTQAVREFQRPSGGGNMTVVARQSGGVSPGSVESSRRLEEERSVEDLSAVVRLKGVSSSLSAKNMTYMEPIVSRELPGKSVALKSHPLTEPAIPRALQPSPTARTAATGAFTIEDPLPIAHHLPTTPPIVDLLVCESSYLPVFPSDLSLSGHTSRDPDSQDTDFYVASLLSSLDSAYGYSSLAEKSRLLSSLVGAGEVGEMGTLQLCASDVTGTSGEDASLLSQSVSIPVLDPDQAAVRIQAMYRRHICREKYKRYCRQVKAATLIQASWRGYVARKRDTQVIMVRAEISRVKVEAFAHTLYSELQCCKQELAEQVALARLQENTLQTLLLEVKDLQLWRSEVRGRERERAVLLLQKYWRGYMARKRFPPVTRGLSQRSLQRQGVVPRACGGHMTGFSSPHDKRLQWAVSELTFGKLIVGTMLGSTHGQDHIQVAPQVHNLTAVFHVARDLTCQWACHASCGWGNFTFGGPGGHDIPDCASSQIVLSSLSEHNDDTSVLSDSYEELSPVQDLQMAHHSDVCILLQWTPPLSPTHDSSHYDSSHSVAKRLGYRVYVNGVAEGLVGPDKLKAYIEGLDMDTTYRITVRVVYSAGESKDSNPIIASLHSGPPRASHQAGGLMETSEVSQGKIPSSPSSSLCDESESEVVTTRLFHQQSSGNTSLSSHCSPIPTHVSNLDVNSSEKSNLGGATAAVGGADMPSWGSNSNVHHQFENKLVPSPGVTGPQVSLDEDSGKGHMSTASSCHTTHSSGSASNDTRNMGNSSQKSIPTDLKSGDNPQSLDTSSFSGELELESRLLATPGKAKLEGDLVDTELKGEECGHMKPCPDKPALEGSLTSQPMIMTSLLSNTYPGSPSLPLGTSGPATPPLSGSVGALQQPITTSSLIRSTTSSPFLPPLISCPGPGNTFDTPAMQYVSSAPLNDPLNDPSRRETKQSSPFAASSVPVMATLGGAGLEYTYALRPAVGALADAGSEVAHDMYRHSLAAYNMKSKVTDPKLNTSCEVQLHTTASHDVIGSTLWSENSSENCLEGGYNLNLSAARDSLVGGSQSQVGVTGKSSNTPQAEMIGRGILAEGDTDVTDSELAAAEPRQDQYKQTTQLSSDYEKCFEEGKEQPPVPRRDSDSITSLAEATATDPDNTQGSSPLHSQTMPLVLFKGQPQGLGTLISEGVSSGHGVEVRSASRSVHMASVLLSQLESELTSSLNEGNT